MKILHVIARLNVGGTARWLSTLSAEQIRHGHEVLVAAGTVQGHEMESALSASMPVVRINALGRDVSLIEDGQATIDVRNLIGDFRPDVVNTHTAKAGTVGRFATRSLGRKRPALVHTVHGHLLQGYFSNRTARLVRLSERMLGNISDLILAAGRRVGDDLVAAGIAGPDKVRVVHPGISDSSLKSQGDATSGFSIAPELQSGVVVGWLARVVPVKRPDRFVRAARAISDATFLLGGDGPLLADVHDLAPGNLRTTGWIDPGTFWSMVDVAVLTSDNEAMPYSLLEAALAGVPCVTTNVGSAGEVVEDGVTGFVVPPSQSSIEDAIRELISNPAERKSMGAAARDFVLRTFSPERMFIEHDDAYAEAICRLRS